MTPAARLRTGLGAALLVASSWLAVASSDAQSVPPLTQKTGPNRVGINNANPASTLDINGSTNANGNVTVTGTVNATAFHGDGSQLTGLVVPGPAVSDPTRTWRTTYHNGGKLRVVSIGMTGDTSRSDWGVAHSCIQSNGGIRFWR